jgi:hypothetical protein
MLVALHVYHYRYLAPFLGNTLSALIVSYGTHFSSFSILFSLLLYSFAPLTCTYTHLLSISSRTHHTIITYAPTTLRTHYLSVLLYEDENFSAFWSHSGGDHTFHLLSSLIISCKSDLIHYFICSDETFKVETSSSKQKFISSTCLFPFRVDLPAW